MFQKYRLRFDATQEALYVENVYENNLSYWRYILSVFVVLFMLFSLLDFPLIDEAVLAPFLLLRFVVVVPLFMITIGLTFTPLFKKYYELLLLSNFIIGGLVVATMLILSPETLPYYGGLFLILFSGILLLRIRLIYAAVGAVIVITYLIFGWLLFTGVDVTKIASIVFYVAAIIIGLFGLYNLEKFVRESFHYERRLIGDRNALASRVNAQLEDLHKAQTSTILALSKLVESRDHVTGEHVEKVSALVRKITMALPDDIFAKEPLPKAVFVDVITNACALHDIGKVGIPDVILNKPGPLNDDERRIMQKHVMIGYETLSTVRNQYPDNAFINMGCDIALYHHERVDGNGYPHGLKGDLIPLSARIMALVDVFDALRSKRPYKEPWSREKAILSVVQGRDTHFDQRIVDAFIKVMSVSSKQKDAFIKTSFNHG